MDLISVDVYRFMEVRKNIFACLFSVRNIINVMSWTSVGSLNGYDSLEVNNMNFLTLYWNEINKRSLYLYIATLHMLTNTYTTALTTKQAVRKVFPPLVQ